MKFGELKKHLKALALVAVAALFMTGCSSQYPVLDPVGPVGQEELHLITLSTILVLIVIIPVFVILGFIIYRYRDKPGNKAPYQPHWADSKTLEVVWWGIPIVIIGILGFQTVKSTFSLSKPPVTNATPITIQATALDWKWVFTYPDQKIATVNYVNIPAGVPVQFELTADAPMNSFWIPALGGQEYAMPGMDMRLFLEADKPGTYDGYGANFSGEGFAHMSFKVNAEPQANFNAWVSQVKQTAPVLTKDGYDKLTQPSTSAQLTFSAYPAGIYEQTVDKNGGEYMQHVPQANHDVTKPTQSGMSSNMPGMNMTGSTSGTTQGK